MIAQAIGMRSAAGAFLIIAACMFQRPIRRPVPVLVLAYTAWSLLSISWSVLPGATVDASLRILIISTAVLFVAWTLPWQLLARHLALGLALLCALSLVAAIISPSTAFDDGLRGVMGHKNGQGFVAATNVVNCGIMVWRSRKWRSYLVCGIVSFITLVLSNSMTSLLTAILGLLAALILAQLRRLTSEVRELAKIFLFVAVTSAVLLASTSLTWLTMAFGRDPTFTGRTQIWSAVLGAIMRRPLTGYGYDAPWEKNSPMTGMFLQQVGFSFFGAHNGYLDAMLQLGIVGFLILCLIWVGALVRFAGGKFGPRGSAWGPGLLIFLLLHNLSEASAMVYTGWLLLSYLGAAKEFDSPRRNMRPNQASRRI